MERTISVDDFDHAAHREELQEVEEKLGLELGIDLRLLCEVLPGLLRTGVVNERGPLVARWIYLDTICMEHQDPVAHATDEMAADEAAFFLPIRLCC